MDFSIAMTQLSALSQWSYDVFLSFRGKDTDPTSPVIVLQQKGVNVFIDDKFKRGELISESLFRFIEEALISIVIFSENYAYVRNFKARYFGQFSLKWIHQMYKLEVLEKHWPHFKLSSRQKSKFGRML